MKKWNIRVLSKDVKLFDQLHGILHHNQNTLMREMISPEDFLIEGIEQHPFDILLLDSRDLSDGSQRQKILARLKAMELVDYVVLLSGSEDVEIRVNAYACGLKQFLRMPPDSVELAAIIENMGQRTIGSKPNRRECEQDLQDVVTQLKNATLETIYTLAKAVEYKDHETGGHIRRMSQYAVILARKIGLSETHIEKILYASPMHDIGKIGIPDSILLKPGKLTYDEWEIMRTHTRIGAEILSGSDSEVVQLGQRIAKTHHERWDGKGYPDGLSGEEIPIEGRIAAMADVFDALTSDRIYKKRISLPTALDIMRSERGKHFDPRMVDAFRQCWDEILQVDKTYSSDKVS